MDSTGSACNEGGRLPIAPLVTTPTESNHATTSKFVHGNTLMNSYLHSMPSYVSERPSFPFKFVSSTNAHHPKQATAAMNAGLAGLAGLSGQCSRLCASNLRLDPSSVDAPFLATETARRQLDVFSVNRLGCEDLQDARK